MSHFGVRRNRRSHLNWHYGGTFLDGRSQRASVLSAILGTVHREASFDGRLAILERSLYIVPHGTDQRI